MIHSINHETIALVPLAGSPVQSSYLIRLLHCLHCLHCLHYQTRIQNFAKEVMIAIPIAPVIEWNYKEVATLQGL
jgi:hypothetical protein